MAFHPLRTGALPDARPSLPVSARRGIGLNRKMNKFNFPADA
jgi:hypothetical protein